MPGFKNADCQNEHFLGELNPIYFLSRLLNKQTANYNELTTRLNIEYRLPFPPKTLNFSRSQFKLES